MAIPFPKKKLTKAQAAVAFEILARQYPQAETELHFSNSFELLIAVILSAQCTDVRVNQTTPTLFAVYPTARELARANLADVESIIRSCGFYRMKARNIVATARDIVEKHDGEVPSTREELEALAGVGRKTAGVVLSVAFEQAAFAVDTHVFRVAHRLGFSLGKTPREVERDVTKLLPSDQWRHAHHWLILHGRALCKAQRPLCERCPLVELCPAAGIVTKTATGRKNPGATGAGVRRPARSGAAASKASSRRRNGPPSKGAKD